MLQTGMASRSSRKRQSCPESQIRLDTMWRKVNLILIQDSTVKNLKMLVQDLSGDLLMPRTVRIPHPKRELSIPVCYKSHRHRS